MFFTAIVLFFAFGICKNEIECATIHRRVDNADSIKNSTDSIFLKRIDNGISNDRRENLPIGKSEDNENTDDASSLMVKNGEPILSSGRKNDPIKSQKVGQRRPKFIGPLAFLAGLSAGGLATVASSNANIFARLTSGALSLHFSPLGYFAGFYNPETSIPYPYPVLQYPVVTGAPNNNSHANTTTEVLTSSSLPPLASISLPKNLTETIIKSTEDKVPPKSSSTFQTRKSSDEVQTNGEIATSELDSKRVLSPDEKVEPIISDTSKLVDQNIASPIVAEETGLRLFGLGGSATTTTTTTTTTEAPNVTVPTVPVKNTTESSPFQGYYSGHPQNVTTIILTTEDPQQRYLKDYTEDTFPLPFERPAAIFNPHQNVESYSNPFVNSFSPAEQFPEFLNTVESDRYIYDTENRQNFNGFRPIFK